MLAKTVGVAAVAAALSGAVAYTLLDTRLKPIEDRMQHLPPILVLNTSKLVDHWVESGETSDKVHMQIGRVQQSLNTLASSGYLVLRADAVAVAPPEMDVTDDLLPKEKQNSTP